MLFSVNKLTSSALFLFKELNQWSGVYFLIGNETLTEVMTSLIISFKSNKKVLVSYRQIGNMKYLIRQKIALRFLITLLLITSLTSYGQSKNFIDQPYLETTARVDTLVIPDRIYLSILITEADTKGKTSVEKLENKMADKLKTLGIDIEKQLTLTDLGSNFKKYFLRKVDVQKDKEYSLLVYDAVTAGKVIMGLESIGISNVNLTKTEYSGLEKLKINLRQRAVRCGKKPGRSNGYTFRSKTWTCSFYF